MNLKDNNVRTKRILNNIGLSAIGKLISALSSYMVIPITIDYVNPTRYGIWLTLSSIIAWVGLFDIGFGHGFRNRFSTAMALGNIKLGREYVSTAYFAIGTLMSVAFVLFYFVNQFANWSSLLNIDNSFREELYHVFLIICAFFCFKMFLGVFTIMLTADQKPGITSLIQSLGSLLSVICIYILTKNTVGSLRNLSIAYSGIPCITLLVITLFFFLFHPKYKYLAPKISFIRKDLIGSILSLGLQFFLINVCLLFVFQLSNIVISRELSPVEVTYYNISHKYFNILYLVINIIINPFWSAFTEAKTLGDYKWMRNMIIKLEKVWLLSIFCGFIMLLSASTIYKIWIGNTVQISFSLNLCMFIYYVVYIIGNIYMYLINGIGSIRIQLVIYIIFAIISWPMLVLFCRYFGVCGIVLVPAIVLSFQTLFGKIQLSKIVNGKASGIWLK